MVPAAITGLVVDELTTLLEPDDVIIDGGNSYYRDDIDRADSLAAKEIHYTARTPAASNGAATPRRHRSAIVTTTATRSMWPPSRRYGGAARSSPPGCST
jgi:6-phosphogluconate dehydrogenase (decarboxylating)